MKNTSASSVPRFLLAILVALANAGLPAWANELDNRNRDKGGDKRPLERIGGREQAPAVMMRGHAPAKISGVGIPGTGKLIGKTLIAVDEVDWKKKGALLPGEDGDTRDVKVNVGKGFEGAQLVAVGLQVVLAVDSKQLAPGQAVTVEVEQSGKIIAEGKLKEIPVVEYPSRHVQAGPNKDTSLIIVGPKTVATPYQNGDQATFRLNGKAEKLTGTIQIKDGMVGLIVSDKVVAPGQSVTVSLIKGDREVARASTPGFVVGTPVKADTSEPTYEVSLPSSDKSKAAPVAATAPAPQAPPSSPTQRDVNQRGAMVVTTQVRGPDGGKAIDPAKVPAASGAPNATVRITPKGGGPADARIVPALLTKTANGGAQVQFIQKNDTPASPGDTFEVFTTSLVDNPDAPPAFTGTFNYGQDTATPAAPQNSPADLNGAEVVAALTGTLIMPGLEEQAVPVSALPSAPGSRVVPAAAPATDSAAPVAAAPQRPTSPGVVPTAPSTARPPTGAIPIPPQTAPQSAAAAPTRGASGSAGALNGVTNRSSAELAMVGARPVPTFQTMTAARGVKSQQTEFNSIGALPKNWAPAGSEVEFKPMRSSAAPAKEQMSSAAVWVRMTSDTGVKTAPFLASVLKDSDGNMKIFVPTSLVKPGDRSSRIEIFHEKAKVTTSLASEKPLFDSQFQFGTRR